MYILNPDPYSTPSFRIGTFQTSSIKRNLKIGSDSAQFAIDYFNKRFGIGNWIITKNGREAISLALQLLNLPKEKDVTILTPSNNFYISSCVTDTISKYSNWNRVRTDKTSAFFVNHEFGYLFDGISNLLGTGLPLIEDCCTTFFSQDENERIGRYGDFSIYSFPKFFGIQVGGILVGKKVGDNLFLKNIDLQDKDLEYILKVVGYELIDEKSVLKERKSIFEYATKRFQELGFSLRFPNQEGVVPSVLLLKNNGIIGNLIAHKDFLYKHGIQNSVFYGEDAFFIPCHQNLDPKEIDYFRFVTEEFIKLQ